SFHDGIEKIKVSTIDGIAPPTRLRLLPISSVSWRRRELGVDQVEPVDIAIPQRRCDRRGAAALASMDSSSGIVEKIGQPRSIQTSLSYHGVRCGCHAASNR